MSKEKSRTYQKLSENKLEEMFGIYCLKPAVSHVASVCGVAERTVRLWRDRGKWDERRRTVLTEAAKNTNEKIAGVFAEHLAICSEIREILYNQVKALKAGTKIVSEPFSRLAKSLIEILKFERAIYAETNQETSESFEKGEINKRVDKIMERGGEQATRLRKMFSQLTDIVMEEPDMYRENAE